MLARSTLKSMSPDKEINDFINNIMSMQPRDSVILGHPDDLIKDGSIAYHPYYGYVENPDKHDINRHGFRNDFDHRERDEDLFQIGIS